MKNNDFDFMENFYEVIDAPIEDACDDDILYVGDEDDETLSDFEDDWCDDITFIGEDEEEEELYCTDLGEGFIPLPQGDGIEYKTIVIDENYVLDEFETDFANETSEQEQEQEDVLKSVVVYDEENDEDINKFFDKIDSAESSIEFPESKSFEEELSMGEEQDQELDRISKQIAKDYIQETEAAVDLLPGDQLNDSEEDNSWINNDDLFGNNVDVIIADDPCKEIEDDDFVNGSFNDWVKENTETTL